MLFSVIIPTYNRANLIPETLKSLFSQSYKDYEMIVVDDGSTDETQNYLKTLEGRITVLTQPNCGPGVARNLARTSLHVPDCVFVHMSTNKVYGDRGKLLIFGRLPGVLLIRLAWRAQILFCVES